MKKKLATVWLDGCSGCHMSFLDIDEKLLEVLQFFDIVYSPLVDSKEFPESVDVTFVEGAISTTEDIKKIKEIRKKSRIIVAMGDCAITGNVPSMRNSFNLNSVIDRGYGENSDNQSKVEFYDLPPLLTNVLPVNSIIHVNFYLPGCPPPADAFYNLIKSILNQEKFDVFQHTRFGK